MSDALFPPLAADAAGELDVSGGHRIHWETAGAPDGHPVVVLHGGPGAGSSPAARQHFDPARYRIVQFDQRGCGRSVPSAADPAAFTNNTTWDLVADLEALRSFLDIERWQVFGGSWGAALALAYAQRHPERVTSVVLRGTFAARTAELDWLYRGGGAAMLFPEAWQAFLAPLPSDVEDHLAAYHRLVFDPDPAVHRPAAAAWSAWEGAVATLVPQRAVAATYGSAAFALPFARLALHYFTHDAWLEPDQLIRDAGRLADVPGEIVHGRYDTVCPADTAFRLHRAWPGSRLTILPTAGHAVSEIGVCAALREATDRFAELR